MAEQKTSLTELYFDDVYRNNEDPWSFETSPYEAAKYQATIDALPKEHYENAFEIGCSIGVLSKMLTAKCKKLLAVDVAETALAKARQRLQDFPNVAIEKMIVPQQFPSSQFDLILISEVGYYLSMEDLGKLRQQILDNTTSGAHILLVHWTPFVPDYPLTGDEVHDFFLEETGADKPLYHLLSRREEKYRLDLFEKQ